MGDSKRQLICNAFDARLKTILTTNGYNTDLGLNVFEWRDTPFELNELPAINWRDLLEDDSNATAGTIGYHNHGVTFELKVVTAKGSTTAKEVRAILADLIAAVAVDQTWDKLALRTDPVKNEMEVEEAERIVGGMTVTLNIIYQTKKWNPYT